MQFDKKIDKILETLNQSGIAYDQQRSNNKNSYKYTPHDGSPSYSKYGIPTVKAAKVQGQPFMPNGLSDEEKTHKDETEILIPGFGRMLAYQLEDKIYEYIDRMKKTADREGYGGFDTLTSNLRLFAKTLYQYKEQGKHIYKG